MSGIDKTATDEAGDCARIGAQEGKGLDIIGTILFMHAARGTFISFSVQHVCAYLLY